MATYKFDFAMRRLRDAIHLAEFEGNFDGVRDWANEVEASYNDDTAIDTNDQDAVHALIVEAQRLDVYFAGIDQSDPQNAFKALQVCGSCGLWIAPLRADGWICVNCDGAIDLIGDAQTSADDKIDAMFQGDIPDFAAIDASAALQKWQEDNWGAIPEVRF